MTMNQVEVEPNISNFITSLRDIGYSFDTAIADIVDNSISAGAKIIDIYASGKEKYVVISDNGRGMTKDELKESMRLGSCSPFTERPGYDLGRFGLGLKTASFSQCKKLTVISKCNNDINAYCWDLDYLVEQNRWLLKEIAIDTFKDKDWFRFLEVNSEGTIIFWENIDRYDEFELNEKFDNLRNHLSITFHRFLEGEFPSRTIKITFNNRVILPFNPFNDKNQATQRKPTERFEINGEDITVTPYILPHPNKVSKEEYEKYATNEGYQKTQGFYLYRAGRLLIYGTWFKLHKQSEAHKLVRIKIDISNKMDFLWEIDVKKSTATPIPQIKHELKRIIGQITNQGFQVYRQRGHKITDTSLERYWYINKQNGKTKYCINKDHPMYKILYHSLPEEDMNILNSYLADIEKYIPIDSIIAQAMEKPHDINQFDECNVITKINNCILEMKKMNLSNDDIFSFLSKCEGFSENINFIKQVLEDLDDK